MHTYPLVSCQMNGVTVCLPVDRAHIPDGAAMVRYAAEGDHGEISSIYTGSATPTVPGAGVVESPTRTTRTESAWNESTWRVPEGVVVIVGVGEDVNVDVGVGVVVEVVVAD